MRKKFIIAGLLLGSAFLASPVSAAVRYVCPGFYTTIQAAVNASAGGDTIIVCPATYTETVFIDPGKDYLTILSTEVSERGPNTVLYGGFRLGFAPNNGPDGVTVKGFTIRGGQASNGVCMESAGNDATFAFNTIENCSGPYAGGDGGVRLNDGTFGSTVHHNTVLCGYTTRAQGFGINAEAQSLGGGWHTIHHNTVDGCVNAITVSASDNTIQHNFVKNSEQAELNVQGDNNQIHHNTVCDVVFLASSAGGNQVHHNVYTGTTIQNLGGNSNKIFKNEQVTVCPF